MQFKLRIQVRLLINIYLAVVRAVRIMFMVPRLFKTLNEESCRSVRPSTQPIVQSQSFIS